MSLYIIDTDHISLLLEGNQTVASRFDLVASDIAIAIITVQEVFNG